MRLFQKKTGGKEEGYMMSGKKYCPIILVVSEELIIQIKRTLCKLCYVIIPLTVYKLI